MPSILPTQTPLNPIPLRLHQAVLACSVLCPLWAAAADAEVPLTTPFEAAPESAPAPTVWEGAIGLNASFRPEYSGSARQVSKLTPAIFLRYGRFTVTNASGFVTRRADDVVRGLGLDLVNDSRLRINLALRFDAGRNENTSTALTGAGNIQATVRARLNLGWRFEGPWRLGASWSVDALGRGGGNFGDLSGGWEHAFSPSTVLTAGLNLSAAGDRYMQTYYGISTEQAARTGYPVYTPRSGLRDLGSSVGFRSNLGDDWIWLGGASATRLIGPAAQSPLTGKRNGFGINTGLARRF